MEKVTVTIDLKPSIAAEVKRRFNGNLALGINTLLKEWLAENDNWKN